MYPLYQTIHLSWLGLSHNHTVNKGTTGVSWYLCSVVELNMAFPSLTANSLISRSSRFSMPVQSQCVIHAAMATLVSHCDQVSICCYLPFPVSGFPSFSRSFFDLVKPCWAKQAKTASHSPVSTRNLCYVPHFPILSIVFYCTSASKVNLQP